MRKPNILSLLLALLITLFARAASRQVSKTKKLRNACLDSSDRVSIHRIHLSNSSDQMIDEYSALTKPSISTDSLIADRSFVNIEAVQKRMNSVYLFLLLTVAARVAYMNMLHVILPYARVAIASTIGEIIQFRLRIEDNLLSPMQRLKQIQSIGFALVSIWCFLFVKLYLCVRFPTLDRWLHYQPSHDSLSADALFITNRIHSSIDSVDKQSRHGALQHLTAQSAFATIDKTDALSTTKGALSPMNLDTQTAGFQIDRLHTIRLGKARYTAVEYHAVNCSQSASNWAIIRPDSEHISQSKVFNHFSDPSRYFGLSINEVHRRQHLFGRNTVAIPQPTLLGLVCDKILSPHFILQLGLQFIGFIDEGLIEPVMRIMANVAFDIFDVYRQTKNFNKIFSQRKREDKKSGFFDLHASADDGSLFVLRSGKWITIPPSCLVPGDLLMMTTDRSSTSEATLVPADCLLISGEALVDEASLSGESIPSAKLPLLQRDKTTTGLPSTHDTLDYDKNKDHILFAGTKLLAADSGNKSKLKSKPKILKSLGVPSSHVLCLVLRIGSSTFLGNIIDDISSSSSISSGTGAGSGSVVLSKDAGLASKSSAASMLTSITGDCLKTTAILVASAAVLALNIYRVESKQLLQPTDKDKRSVSQEIHHRLNTIISISRVFIRLLPSDLYSDVTYHIPKICHRLMKECDIVTLRPDALSSSGLVSVCLFDKTGTICDDSLLVQKIFIFIPNDKLAAGKPTMKELIAADGAEAFLSINSWPDIHQSMAVTHSLSTTAGQQYSGDPLEMAVLNHLSCLYSFNFSIHNVTRRRTSYRKISLTTNSVGRKKPIILKTHEISEVIPFDTSLQRMSVIKSLDSDHEIVSCKGSPESIFNCLIDEQKSDQIFKTLFFATFNQLALEGNRVIAYAAKKSYFNGEDCINRTREDIESQLVFQGFVCLSSPVRKDSKSVIQTLLQANLDVKIISGDSLATCCYVGNHVGILSSNKAPSVSLSNVLVLRQLSNYEYFSQYPNITLKADRAEIRQWLHRKRNLDPSLMDHRDVFVWTTIFGDICYDFNTTSTVTDNIAAEISELLGQTIPRLNRLSAKDVNKKGMYAVVEGPVLKSWLHSFNSGSYGSYSDGVKKRMIHSVVKYFKIIARADPRMKERIVRCLRDGNDIVMMCGDGMNDVTALANADVGIAIPIVDHGDHSTITGSTSTSTSSGDRQEQSQVEITTDRQVALVSHFSSKKASISASIDLIKYGRLAHRIYLINNIMAVFEPLAWEYGSFFLRRIYGKFRLTMQQQVFWASLSLLFSSCLLRLKPPATLLNTTSRGILRSIFDSRPLFYSFLIGQFLILYIITSL